jgi:ABC-type transport system involved in multi-copper enzyme maturation permease subunit
MTLGYFLSIWIGFTYLIGLFIFFIFFFLSASRLSDSLNKNVTPEIKRNPQSLEKDEVYHLSILA